MSDLIKTALIEGTLGCNYSMDESLTLLSAQFRCLLFVKSSENCLDQVTTSAHCFQFENTSIDLRRAHMVTNKRSVNVAHLYVLQELRAIISSIG